jgi:hypothetical protein
MALSSTARRRWFGGVVLALAVGMLIAGETVLKSRFPAGALLFYWLICLALTLLAIAIAFRDVRESHEKAVREQRTLLEATIADIQRDAQGKRQNKNKNGKGP